MDKVIGRGYSYDDVLLVPEYSNIDSRDKVDLSTRITDELFLKIPIVSANMDTITGLDMAIAMAHYGGLGILHRYCSPEDQAGMVVALKELNTDFNIGAAVGVGDDLVYRTDLLLESGVDLVLVDVAHADHIKVIEAVRTIRVLYEGPLMVGNIATQGAARRLIDVGADSLKVGIGPGMACDTRRNTGAGVPQLTAISTVSEASKPFGVTVCADGGMWSPGDIVKAIGFGADMVMLGSMFSGTDESLGFNPEGSIFRGMAGAAAKQDNGMSIRHVEGRELSVPNKGPVSGVLDRICDGIRSGFSYSGAANMVDFYKRSRFIEISSNARRVSR